MPYFLSLIDTYMCCGGPDPYLAKQSQLIQY